MDNRAVGVFDSGVGGISALRDLVRRLPDERFIYYGDTANAPYGSRTEPEILRLSLDIVDKLLARDVKALVIACNTITSAAASVLRSRLSIPVIGTEPALKPASMAARGGKVLVMATEATLRQKKFRDLCAQYGRDAVPLPCPELVGFAERGEINSPALDEYLKNRFAPLRETAIDAAVLGCTHFVFLKSAIARALPGTPLFDGNDGVARRLQALLTERNALCQGQTGSVEFQSSCPDAVPLMKKLYLLPI